MKQSFKTGILQAVGVALYCSLISIVMSQGNKLFGVKDSFVTPIAVLVMLSTSALTCGLIVFYKPYKLFFANKKSEAIDVVVATAVSLFVILLGLFGVMYLLNTK